MVYMALTRVVTSESVSPATRVYFGNTEILHLPESYFLLRQVTPSGLLYLNPLQVRCHDQHPS
ncbi:hypothetical protein EMIT0P201_50517 [Pseudomonas chlororaphis]